HKPIHFLVHRLIAETFLEIPNGIKNIVVNHKDGDKLNNNVENLEWVSQSYNCEYAYKLTPEIKERCKSYTGKNMQDQNVLITM
ncbi:HNH endonuclease, partial [Campylobacter fetus]|nr:HNH endonuclease [Campylobacter fetus]